MTTLKSPIWKSACGKSARTVRLRGSRAGANAEAWASTLHCGRVCVKLLGALAGFLMSAAVFSGTLPAGYTQLMYIESTGTQYIDTGVVFAYTNGFSITYQVTSAESQQRFCGSIGSATDSRCCVGANSQGDGDVSLAYVGWNGLVVSSTAGVQDMSMGTIDVNYRNLRFYNCRDAGNGKVEVLKTQNATFCLFACKNSNGTLTYGKCRIMAFRISSGDNIAMDCVPARRDSDGVLGMYDIVGGAFFTNRGTGTFTGGAAIGKPGQSGYVVLDYLESTGAGQYIDTGVIFTGQHGFAITYQNVRPASFHVFCGSRADGDSRCFLGSNGQTTPTATIGWNTVVESGNVNDLCKGTASVNLYASKSYDCRGTSGSVSADLADQGSNTFALFAYKFNGSISNHGNCRISSFTMTKGSDVVMSLTPIRRLSDGALGMYDIDRRVFYPNLGSGEFLAGAPLEVVYTGGTVIVVR